MRGRRRLGFEGVNHDISGQGCHSSQARIEASNLGGEGRNNEPREREKTLDRYHGDEMGAVAMPA